MRTVLKNIQAVFPYLLSLLLISCLAVWLIHTEARSGWHSAGLINLSLGFVLLTAFFSAQVLKSFHLPLISGYILTGIIAGPYVSGLLSQGMVDQLRLTDSLALSFIALTAGGSLEVASLRSRLLPIFLHIFLQTLFVFFAVFLFILLYGTLFSSIAQLPPLHIMVLAILLGVISIARSPSSAIAIIKECRAKGPHTETVLGVTVVIDVLIILFFTLGLAVAKMLITRGGAVESTLFWGLSLEIALSLVTGAFLGKLISLFIERIGQDLLLFLFFIAFGVTRISLWFSELLDGSFHISLHLEPLLICMSAGFFVQNFSKAGTIFIEYLDKMALPIFVLFFSLAGASMNLDSLILCWPFAACLVIIRIAGIFFGTWLTGVITKDPPIVSRSSWMAYLTQAGVAIGLAQLAGRQLPEIANYLTTVVLAVITINQMIGPIFLKVFLNLTGESDKTGCELPQWK